MIGTKNDRKTMRAFTTEDFRELRRAMGWKWEDVNAITGLALARTNMTKGLPAWVNLALEVQRRAEQQLRLGVVDSIVQRLGADWEGSPTPSGGVVFRCRKEEIELSFAPGTFTVKGRSVRAAGLVDQLELLYGIPTRKRRPKQGTFSLIQGTEDWSEQLTTALDGGSIF
ncbi:MAG: hypothetical protein AAFN92_13840 [Bacteroidota bacterium]